MGKPEIKRYYAFCVYAVFYFENLNGKENCAMKFLKMLARASGSIIAAAGIAIGSLSAAAAAEEIQLPENEAIAFVNQLGAGWNLGNAFDASNCTWLSNEMDYESAWCGAKTTKDLIRAVKEIGFDTIRIPVSWHNHVNSKLEISDAWADRVQEVVDWSLDAGLKVILNAHHDVQKGYYYPTKEEYDTSEKYITAVWKQIAERYSGYDKRLIFEIINEPRAAGTNYEWWFNVNNPGKDVLESVDCVNRLNQAALDTIRAAGGKNKDRYVMVCGYDTSTDGLAVSGFSLPKDSVKNRLIVTMHIYTSKAADFQRLLNTVYKRYVKNGIPAVLGEYNLDMNKNAYGEKSAEYLGNMVKYARERGISSFIWDNNAKEYQLIDRSSASWSHPEIARSIVENGKPSLSQKNVNASADEAFDCAKRLYHKIFGEKSDAADGADGLKNGAGAVSAALRLVIRAQTFAFEGKIQ